MRQIAAHPVVALCGDWFTGHGVGENLGYFGRPENAAIAQKLRAAFCRVDRQRAHDFQDVNTCILRIRLTDGVLFSHGTRYEMREE